LAVVNRSPSAIKKTPQAGEALSPDQLQAFVVRGIPTTAPANVPAQHRNEIVMTHSVHATLHIDRVHNAAIRREIGDRLRISLNAERAPMPPRLSSLLDRLAAQDRRDAAPILY